LISVVQAQGPKLDSAPNTYRDSAAVVLSGVQESGGAELTGPAF